MASQKYILTEIKKGYNLSWYVCSQCYYAGTIKLYDDTGKVYFTCSKTSGSTSYQSLAQGHDDFTGNELYLSVEIPQSTKIQQSITANSVTDASQHLSVKSFLRNVFSSIPFCIYLIMIVMAFLHLALPHPVIIFTKIAGDANAFLCMLMIGVNIHLQMDSKSFRCIIKHIAVRYALSGVLAFLFYRCLPFSLEIRQAMAVIALAPSSSLALIFTMKLKGDVIMAGNICSLSILLSTIAMTILLVYL